MDPGHDNQSTSKSSIRAAAIPVRLSGIIRTVKASAAAGVSAPPSSSNRGRITSSIQYLSHCREFGKVTFLSE